MAPASPTTGVGEGPAVLLIGAGPTDRSAEAPLAELLAEHFTSYNFDRRGRGESGDTQPYAVDREFEDIQAVIDAAGGSVFCYGTSGGAIIALQAAARGLPITRLALWEPPYILPGTRTPIPADYRDRQWAYRADGRGGDMLELFFTDAIGMPAEMVAGMKAAPFWEAMAAGGDRPGLRRQHRRGLRDADRAAEGHHHAGTGGRRYHDAVDQRCVRGAEGCHAGRHPGHPGRPAA